MAAISAGEWTKQVLLAGAVYFVRMRGGMNRDEKFCPKAGARSLLWVHVFSDTKYGIST
jgi:ribosomal protein S27AE